MSYQQVMDDDELIRLLARGWALLCASISGSSGIGSDKTIARARSFERYMLKDTEFSDD